MRVRSEREFTGLEKLAIAVAGVLISGSITSSAALLLGTMRQQSVQQEQILALKEADARLQHQLGNIRNRMEVLTPREEAKANRAATDHNWEVIERLRIRLQTVENTLWPVGSAWRLDKAHGEQER